jgi:hypothetical protein
MISFWISVVPPKKDWIMTEIVLSNQRIDIRDVHAVLKDQATAASALTTPASGCAVT